ncbi:hypothetical protein [Ancylobacter polymorphus]|uniref:Uncharacterized protein n=1 Tax=Ancylobacter polymorphus TaxID=223390 RepID=A0A9E7D4D4_9HYPH|nr:hypothetical protein [Ancylobacter polymorphus]UOK71737.1 hypothetical protein K9D25_03140 [Ancylobacter polymorphus]
MNDFEIVTTRRVVDNDGNCDDIEVRPDVDALGLVEIFCRETGASYVMLPAQARLIGQALELCAGEVEAANAP